MKNAWAIALVAVMVGGCGGCGATPYKRLAQAYRAVNYSARVAEDFDASLAKYLVAKHAACKATHKPKTAEFDKCVLPVLRISRTWTGRRAGKPTGKGVLPALQSAQKATRLALDAAYDYVKSHEDECQKKEAPAKCSGDWKVLLRPSLCALAELVGRAIKIGAFQSSESAAYKTVMALIAGFVCPAGK
jgi:hypothetical protein